MKGKAKEDDETRDNYVLEQGTGSHTVPSPDPDDYLQAKQMLQKAVVEHYQYVAFMTLKRPIFQTDPIPAFTVCYKENET